VKPLVEVVCPAVIGDQPRRTATVRNRCEVMATSEPDVVRLPKPSRRLDLSFTALLRPALVQVTDVLRWLTGSVSPDR